MEEKLKFTKYPSLTNSYQQKFIDQIQMKGLDEGQWFVQEKVHGANLSLWVNPDGTTRVAKRTTFIADNDGFFGVERVKTLYLPQAQLLAKNFPGCTVAIYGEICGGHYEGQKDQGSLVQRGVQYSPKNEFLVFDIALQSTKEGEPKVTKFLPFDEAMMLATEYGFLIAPVLFTGSFRECLEYPNEFITKVPELIFGLDPIEDNICEGVVIRPMYDRYLVVGSEGNESSRLIIKNKNTRFSEKEDKPKIKVDNVLAPELQEAFDELSVFLNDNRMEALKSKLGEAEMIPKNFGTILGTFVKDAWEDILKEPEGSLKFLSLEAPQRKVVSKLLSSSAVPFVREVLGLCPTGKALDLR